MPRCGEQLAGSGTVSNTYCKNGHQEVYSALQPYGCRRKEGVPCLSGFLAESGPGSIDTALSDLVLEDAGRDGGGRYVKALVVVGGRDRRKGSRHLVPKRGWQWSSSPTD